MDPVDNVSDGIGCVVGWRESLPSWKWLAGRPFFRSWYIDKIVFRAVASIVLPFGVWKRFDTSSLLPYLEDYYLHRIHFGKRWFEGRLSVHLVSCLAEDSLGQKANFEDIWKLYCSGKFAEGKRIDLEVEVSFHSKRKIHTGKKRWQDNRTNLKGKLQVYRCLDCQRI